MTLLFNKQLMLGIEISLSKAFVFSAKRPCAQGLETIYDVLMT